jgi:hypothetical protein
MMEKSKEEMRIWVEVILNGDEGYKEFENG